MTMLHWLSMTLILAVVSLGRAEQPKVVAVKQFGGIYPASSSLDIPFHGCVQMDGQLPAGDGEHWLSLDHLVKDDDFAEIQVLVDSEGTILGGRAVFKGSPKEWRDERGYASRLRVLFAFLGGDGPEISRDLPLAYDGSGFGDMVYGFDTNGHVSWRIPQNHPVMNEEEYVRQREMHNATCEECKGLGSKPAIGLPIQIRSEPGSANPASSDR